jgi:UDP-3-O-[3-hydroxymyristoyl] glucosamine N-acyltransferase
LPKQNRDAWYIEIPYFNSTKMNQPLANIHPNAKIGVDVIIEPFATISSDVTIGDGSYIGPTATILPGCRIGKNCRIFFGSSDWWRAARPKV